MPEDLEIVIVGQGLAGSLLAYELLRRGCNVTIWDDGHLSSSSKVAAGLWNPISFRRLNQSWLVNDLFPAAERSYRDLESVMNAKFFHPLPLARIFPDAFSANDWDAHLDHPEIARFLSDQRDERINACFSNPFGHGLIREAGWLDVAKLLLLFKKFFQERDRLVIKNVTAEEVESEAQHKKIILCTGWKGNAIKYFDQLPIVPNKGELLTISIPELRMETIVNFGKFLLPLGQGRFRLGSTYSLTDLSDAITSAAREEMLKDLRSVGQFSFEVLDHKSAFRPTMLDRKPVMGFHPQLMQLGIFNGFGSKGVMLVPYFAAAFADFILNATPLIKEVRLERFYRN